MTGQRLAVFGALVLCIAGCAGENATPAPVSPQDVIPARLSDETDGGLLLLSSPSLVSGIPGEGPLTIAELERWLDAPQQHEPLRVTLPWHLRDAAMPALSLEHKSPLTRAKIELGRQLFFDRRLSSPNRNFACADCHHPRDQFAHRGHNLDLAVKHGRAVPVVFNRVLSTRQHWDGRAASLAEQALLPIASPGEMRTSVDDCIARLKSIAGYRLQFERIYGGDISAVHLGDALAAFESCLIVGPAPYDEARRRELAGEALDGSDYPAAAQRGRVLFFSERAGCFHCHPEPNFSDEQFHNIGIGLTDADPDPGRFAVTGDEADFGAFKTPTLRNVALTAPYMHRGQLKSLEEVVAWYAAGPTAAEQQINRGRRDPRAGPLALTIAEQADLVAFLRSLSGPLPPVATGRLPAD